MSRPNIANETTDMVQAELKEYGINSWLEDRGKHIAVAWTFNGKPRTLICARTPSDYRAILNQRADCRRMLRADGATRLVPQVLTLEHALSPPKSVEPQATRLVSLERTIDVLVDMMAELQHEHVALKERLANLKGTVSFSFDSVAAKPEVFVEEITLAPVAAKAYSDVTLEGTPRKRAAKGQRQGLILSALAARGGWVSTADIVKAARGDTTEQAVSAALHQLKIKGLVENGQRGYWKLTADTVREATAS